MSELEELSKIIIKMKSKREVEKLFDEIFTKDEISLLSKRWRILSMLSEGLTQRDIAKQLNVSLCKITRGAKILKDKNSIVYKHFNKENNNGKKHITR